VSQFADVGNDRGTSARRRVCRHGRQSAGHAMRARDPDV
jgi:hypothetical protein